ncbi:neuronal acetylcholine receptor subunit alpha-6-like [Ylistrum balloti]|uniref:neuronal acetylcholine receptor subunit alpha-6-like n=1 Tax=Ylistrum balloti TaxID=509963 RepID=UPI002905E9A0|nr:neuronal acetylcholine receptor subunit alpha-6-like [Ylistrum balloti]
MVVKRDTESDKNCRRRRTNKKRRKINVLSRKQRERLKSQVATKEKIDIPSRKQRERLMSQISGWPYNTDDINLTHKFPYITTNDYQLNGEWLLSSTYVLSVVEDGQRRLNFVMQLERLSAFYTMNVIVPILMTSLLTPMVFKLPSESGERVSFILTVLLALEVLLTVVSANMPATSLHTSVMEVYLVVVLSISALAVLLTSLVLKLYHRGDDTDLPKAIRIVLHSRKHLRRQQLVKSTNEETGLDMGKMKARECHENEDVSSQGIQKLKNNYVSEEFDGLETMKSRGKITCQELSIRLDEILFWVFLCLTVVSTFIFMLTMALGGP